MKKYVNLANALFCFPMLNRPCSSFTNVLKVPRVVSFVLLSHGVAPTLLMSEFVNNFIQIKYFGINGVIWEKTAVVCAFKEEIHQQSLSWKFARKQNLM